VCEGSLFKDQSVIVVGGGDAAIVEAGYLADIARDVTIVVRKNHFRAKDIKARDRVLAKPNVKVLFESRIIKIQGDGTRVTSVVIERVDTGEYKNHPVDGVFLAIGSRPNTALFKDQLECDERGFLVLKEHQATSKAGIFAAGDVCDDVFVQAITSAGQGCMASLQAKKFLEEVGFDAASGGVFQAAVPEEKISKDAVQHVQLEPENAVIELSSMADIKEQVLGSKLPVVIDFYSTWCIPCQQMAPIFEELAKNLEGRVIFAKMNLGNKSLDLPAIFNLIGGQVVSSVPAFIFVRDGKEIGRKIGKTGRQDFEKLIMKTFGLID
jgi:thiol-disulfide isomerase/thioredoxin/siroheme synthase (precorrin-2 oxidase/ferrochelatase)